MTDCSILFAKSAQKELEDLPQHLIARLFPRIRALASNPRPSGCRKIVGETNKWRIRIGDYRVLYSVYDAEHIVKILAVRHRSNAYD